MKRASMFRGVNFLATRLWLNSLRRGDRRPGTLLLSIQASIEFVSSSTNIPSPRTSIAGNQLMFWSIDNLCTAGSSLSAFGTSRENPVSTRVSRSFRTRPTRRTNCPSQPYSDPSMRSTKSSSVGLLAPVQSTSYSCRRKCSSVAATLGLPDPSSLAWAAAARATASTRPIVATAVASTGLILPSTRPEESIDHIVLSSSTRLISSVSAACAGGM